MKLSGTHSASLNGPLPIAVSFLERSGFASPIFFDTMPVFGCAMYAMRAALGFFRLNTTVVSSRAEVNAGTLWGSRLVTSPARARMSVPPFLGWFPLVGDGPLEVVGAQAAMTVARIRATAARERFNMVPPQALLAH